MEELSAEKTRGDNEAPKTEVETISSSGTEVPSTHNAPPSPVGQNVDERPERCVTFTDVIQSESELPPENEETTTASVWKITYKSDAAEQYVEGIEQRETNSLQGLQRFQVEDPSQMSDEDSDSDSQSDQPPDSEDQQENSQDFPNRHQQQKPEKIVFV